MRGCRGPRVVFVAVRSDDNREMRMCIERDDREAHISEAALPLVYAQRSCEAAARRLVLWHRIRKRHTCKLRAVLGTQHQRAGFNGGNLDDGK